MMNEQWLDVEVIHAGVPRNSSGGGSDLGVRDTAAQGSDSWHISAWKFFKDYGFEATKFLSLIQLS